jgi:hypothetical protein
LLPNLLAREVANSRDGCGIHERHGVCEANGYNGRCQKAVYNNGQVPCDATILGVVEHKCKMAVSSTTACCFDG